LVLKWVAAVLRFVAGTAVVLFVIGFSFLYGRELLSPGVSVPPNWGVGTRALYAAYSLTDKLGYLGERDREHYVLLIQQGLAFGGVAIEQEHCSRIQCPPDRIRDLNQKIAEWRERNVPSRR